MKRRLFTVCAALSLLLSLAALFLWLMFAVWGAPGRVLSFSPQRGLWLERHQVSLMRITPVAAATNRLPGNSGPSFRVNRIQGLPYWAVAVAGLVLPAARATPIVIVTKRKRRRIALGLCIHCGYDLRAHGPGQRCPECGTPVPADLVRKPIT